MTLHFSWILTESLQTPEQNTDVREVNFLVQIEDVKAVDPLAAEAHPEFGLFNTLTSYKEGFLLQDWCSGWNRSADVRRMGRFASVGGGSIYVDNTKELYRHVKMHGLSVNGCKLVIYEIDSANKTPLFTGVATDLLHNQQRIEIKFDDPSLYRAATISERVDAETNIPAVFGTLEKAKLVSMLSDVDVYTASEFWAEDAVEIWFGLRKNAELPPVAPPNASDSGYQFELLVGSEQAFVTNNLGNWLGDVQLTLPSDWYEIGDPTNPLTDNLYLENVLGDGAVAIRRIKALRRIAGVPVGDRFLGSIEIITERAFKISEDGRVEYTAELDADYDPEEDNITYFKLFKADFQLAGDVFESGGLVGNDYWTIVDGDYVPIPNGSDLIREEGDGIFRYTPESLEARDISKGARQLEILEVSQQEYPWEIAGEGFERSVYSPQDWDFYNVVGGSFGGITWSPLPQQITQEVIGNGNVLDKSWENGLRFKIPTPYTVIDGEIQQFNGYYILLPIRLKIRTARLRNFKLGLGLQVYTHHVRMEANSRFIERDTETIFGDFSKTIVGLIPPAKTPPSGVGNPAYLNVPRANVIATGYEMADMFDVIDPSEGVGEDYGKLFENDRQFYGQDLSDNTVYYSWMNDATPNNENTFYGWRATHTGEELLNVDISNVPLKDDQDLFNLDVSIRIPITSIGLNAANPDLIPNPHVIVDLRHISVYVEQETEFSEGIYVSWDGRKDGGTPIDTASAVYKHALKLQNYSTAGISTPIKGWGLEYIADYTDLIDASVDALPSIPVSTQLLSKDELDTTSIKDALLRTMWALGFVDSEGQERAIQLENMFNPLLPHASISYSEIIPRSLSPLSDVKKADIFCEPLVRFDYDVGLEEFNKTIAVTKVSNLYSTDADILSNNCVQLVGFTITDEMKVAIYRQCSQLYKKYGVINEAPSELTDNYFIKSSSDGVGYLNSWLRWQGAANALVPEQNWDAFSEMRGVNFSLPYSLAITKEIDLGRLIKLDVPHLETLGEITGIITSVSYSLKRGAEGVNCKAVVKINVETAENIILEQGFAGLNINESGDEDTNIVETGDIA